MANFKNPMSWLLDYFNSPGVSVNARSTLMVPAFWYGINKISGNIGSLPLNVMRSLDPEGAEKAKTHPVWRLLRKRPNAYQTPFVFKQTETARAIMWGNARSYIYRGRNPEIIPLRPDATVTGMVDGAKWHCTMPDKDDRVVLFDDMLDEMLRNPQKTVMIPDEDCLHIQGFGDGVNGLSLFQVARNTIQIGLSADDRTAKAMKKGFVGKVFLETPADSPEFRDQKKAAEFLKDFTDRHGADGAAESVGMLRGGIKANVLQMSNRDAEFAELQKSNLVGAAHFLLLESILGYDASVSYNSEEQAQLAYLKNCLANWLIRWEEECSFKLLSQTEFYGDYFCKFNTGSLLRTDTQTTMATLSQGIASKILNPNEARAKLDMNPYPGGDAYENPAITPGNSEEPEEIEETGDQPNAMLAHLQHFMSIEEKQVNKRLARGETIEQLDAWYDGWSVTLGDAIEKLGGDRMIAQNHCVQNLQYLGRNPGNFNLTGSAELLSKEINACLT